MGRKAKGQRATARKQQRKAAKLAQINLYASFAKAGKLKGSKRQKRKSKASAPTKHAHLVANCGNPGCKRCFPQLRIAGQTFLRTNRITSVPQAVAA